MRILAVDTALGACSAVVLDGDIVLAHRLEVMARGHAERLAPMVREVMDDAGIGFAALDRLAVTIGPGTFTGQRVGYAFMRGMRLALRRPLIGVTTLAAMAEAALAQTRTAGAAVLHDARRGEVYAFVMCNGSAVMPVQLATLQAAIDAAADATHTLDGPLAFAGTAGAAAAGSIRATGRAVVETDIHAPDALWVARLARFAPEPDVVPRPLYLRPPDARLPAQTNSAP
jgi:tRNA threonylcarbamoyladenosine biosynthesis protein TsaB